MSHQNSSTDAIFDGLLRPDEEANIDQLMERMYGDANKFDYGGWQSTQEQQDIEMTDSIEDSWSDEKRQSNASFNASLNTPMIFPANPTPYTRQGPMIDLTQEGPVIDLTQEATSDTQASLTQQQAVTQPVQRSTAAKQPATKSQQGRPKWKVRQASNAAPTFPRGTWDTPVLTCMNEIKRLDGEFRLHANHTGNQKCAQILKAIFPDKFPETYTIEVIASRVASVWNDRDRGKKAEWHRVREMRDEDEESREEMREKIRATGLV